MVHLVVEVSLKLGLEAPLTADLPSPAVSQLYRKRPFSSSDGAALAAWASKTYFAKAAKLIIEKPH
ncbi:hypothetical protein BK127_17405 [Paenibacillus sp. FSL H7-0331]|nr:hypothetical protein BK127_17405 [Paenibacillus sp. FSL H7-0331]